MRRQPNWWPLAVVIGAFCAFQVAQALVVGIDFGSDSFKVVLVRTGGIDIVLNEGSGRKTVSSVGYSAHGRVFGDQVQQLYTKNPLLVFNAVTQALGRGAASLEQDWIQELQDGDHHLYWLRNATISEEVLPTLEGEETMNRVMLKVGDSEVYPEEVLSQLLAKARQYSSTEAGSPVKDCAITVPFYWSHAQRQALLDAANLAGFNVLSLLNQNLAIAIKFITDRDFVDGPAHVVFYDMGTSDLQVSLYRFESTKGKGKTKWVNNATLLATASESSLGGSTFDSAIVDMWVEKLKEKFGEDYVFPPQVITKLQKQAKRTKEILSANKESHVVIESLLGDFDFKASITRDEFERRTEQLVARALSPLKSVLATANLEPHQIDLFEMFGGGARIPKIQDTLKTYIHPVQLSRHLNTDEAAAFGAAIFAASKSSQHRVKEFNAKDGSNAHYPVLVRATDAEGKPLVREETDSDSTAEPDLDRVLFRENSRLGSRRTLKVKTDKDIYVELKYPQSVKLEKGVSHLIARYKISFPKDLYTRYNVTDTPSAHIRFELTPSGTVQLTTADAQVPVVTLKTVKVKTEVTKEDLPSSSDSTSTEDSNSDADVPTPDTETTDPTEQPSDSDLPIDATSDSTSVDDQTPSEEAETEQEKETEAPVVEETTEIREIRSVTTVKLVLETLATLGLNPTQITEARRRLKVLDDDERMRLETEHAKSDLEALIYSIYDKLEDAEVIRFSTEEERAALVEMLGADSTWLEEDGADSTKAEYLDKKGLLNKVWNKITLRISEHKELPIAAENCQQAIALGREALVKIFETRNVTEADIESVSEAISKVDEFVTATLASETERALHEDPVTLSSQINSRCREFGWRIDFLMRKPRRPKQAPVNPEPTPSSADSEAEPPTEPETPETTQDDTTQHDTEPIPEATQQNEDSAPESSKDEL